MAEKNPFRFLLFETENDAVIILNHAKKVGLIATPTYLNRRTGAENTEITEALLKDRRAPPEYGAWR